MSHLAFPKHRGVFKPIQEFCGALLVFQSSGTEGGVCFLAGKEWFFHSPDSVEPASVVGPRNRLISFLWVTACVSSISSHSLWDSKILRVCQLNERFGLSYTKRKSVTEDEGLLLICAAGYLQTSQRPCSLWVLQLHLHLRNYFLDFPVLERKGLKRM